MPSFASRLSKAMSDAFRVGADVMFNREGPARGPGRPRRTLGVSGTPTWGGFIRNNEQNAALVGSAKYKTFGDLLLNSPIVAASARYFLNLVSRAGWKFQPADESDEAKRVAENVENALLHLMRTPWQQVVRRAAAYRLYGFSVQEWVAKPFPEFGFIGFEDVEARPQRTIERWDVTETGRVDGMEQRSPHDGSAKYLPRSRVLYLVDNALDDSPEGLGLLRQVVSPCHRLKRYETLEGFGYETELKGMPIARAPLERLDEMVANGDLSEEERDERIAGLRDIIENHIRTPQLGLLIDSVTYESKGEQSIPSNNRMYDFDIIKGEVTANGQQAVSVAVERLAWDIARIMGTESLLLGANGRGAFALSRDKTQNLLMVVDGVLLDIVAAVYTDLITPLHVMNGWPMKLRPKPVTDAMTYRDAETIALILEKMGNAGAPLDPDDEAIATVRGSVGLPPPPKVNRHVEAELDLTEAQAEQARRPPPKPTARPAPAKKRDDEEITTGRGG